MPEDIFVEKLSHLDTCAVSDALDSLGIQGAALGIKQVSVAKKITGRAITVKLTSKDSAPPSSRHLGTAAVEAASHGDVIVVEHGRTDVAGWGGNLSVAASQKGISGIIIDGALRDVDEMWSLQFPAYAASAVPVTARGRIAEESCNEPITVAGIDVKPNDLVIADRSGVVFIPEKIAKEVIDKAEEIMKKEEKMAQSIRQGVPVSSVMGKNYETMLQEE
ncbi:Regulator of RNase E activity RraA [Alteribacillus persepolensis]|uniref:Putative 4-hydroxy-4-methyl-2-oxoglutarate aldolase n=1 Tax=Alteribacillus persepolensis TaxID=568899 RepID=A0A1G8AWY8_9BACI|nr:hypothetical protein [Alteribacillus persepolensis]SDH25374.1 Regulator of RNase E activity RraA [Alteribacillus persepolensis]